MCSDNPARDIIQRALDNLRSNPGRFRARAVRDVAGNMCAIGFLNEAAGRDQSPYDEDQDPDREAIYPLHAAKIGKLLANDPLVVACERVVACTKVLYPGLTPRIGDTMRDATIWILNDSQGLEGVKKVFEAALSDDCGGKL